MMSKYSEENVRRFSTNKFITLDQIAFLESTISELSDMKLAGSEIEVRVRIELGKIFDVESVSSGSERRCAIAIDFHYYNYLFCRENAFNLEQTSTFMSIMNEVFLNDIVNSMKPSTVTSSFENLQGLVLKHSVDRPPKSIPIFGTNRIVEDILNFVLENYYRQFKLYKYIFTARPRIIVKQCYGNGVEEPLISLSLNEATELIGAESENL